MTRRAIELPRSRRVADENGNIDPDWERFLEDVAALLAPLADAVDASAGDAAGDDVDDEWNAFVNAIKQD